MWGRAIRRASVYLFGVCHDSHTNIFFRTDLRCAALPRSSTSSALTNNGHRPFENNEAEHKQKMPSKTQALLLLGKRKIVAGSDSIPPLLKPSPEGFS
jgi:hypothetical protein